MIICICDSCGTNSKQEQIRIIPLDNDNNVHLCKRCYRKELEYNQQREIEHLERTIPELPYETYPCVTL